MSEKKHTISSAFDIFLCSITMGLALLLFSHFSTDLKWDDQRELAYQQAIIQQRIPKNLSAQKTKTKWEYIIVHHSATKEGSAKAFDRYHRETKQWKGIAYHFVIGNGKGTKNGVIEKGFRWDQQIPGPHTQNNTVNKKSIAICLVGNFNTTRPSTEQMHSLTSLIIMLQQKYHIPTDHIYTHGDIKDADTLCAGKYISSAMIRRLVQASL